MMRKRVFTVAGLLLCAILCNASNLTKVTFMPQWTAQAQFAGFYVALEKGFYKDAGLDVTIRHRGTSSTESSIDLLMEGEIQFCGLQTLAALIARSEGENLVNVMQITQRSGLMCVAKKPISDPQDLNGMRIARWKPGFAELMEMIAKDYNLDIKWIPSLNSTELFIFGAVDATLCYSYSEFIRLQLAMGDIPESHTIKLSSYDINIPEDGIYTSGKYLLRHPDVVKKFVSASKKGWEYAEEHPEEALAINKKITDRHNILTNRIAQTRMLSEYLKLMVDGESGTFEFLPIEETTFNTLVSTLMAQGKMKAPVSYKDFVR